MSFRDTAADVRSMWRVLGVVEQMGSSLTEGTTTLREVLMLMDRHMAVLQSRLTSDVDVLRRGLEQSNSMDERDRQALTENLRQVEYSATRIGEFTQRDATSPLDDTPDSLEGLLGERHAIDNMAILAFTHSPDAILVADQAGIIRLVNPATELLTGYHSTELHGQHVEILVPDNVRNQHVGLRNGYFHRPNTRPMGLGLNLRIRHRDGHESPVDINLSPVTARGGSLAIITIRTLGSSSHG